MARALLFAFLSLAALSASSQPAAEAQQVSPDEGEAACFQYECSLTLDFWLTRAECQENCGGGFCRAVRFC